MASLANVDGALVITRDLSVIGFGAKIAVGGAAPRVVRLEPGTQAVVQATLEDAGTGMRHQAAVRFADANKDAVALVISQDRHMSVIHWDDKNSSVVILPNAERWIDFGVSQGE
jgi:DNA integrity scanning protein DisA with diadenylate cyclase activity